MTILSIYLDSLQKIESNELDFIDMREVSIFRCVIFGIIILAVPNIFCLFLFFWKIVIFSSALISTCGNHVVWNVDVVKGSMLNEMWQYILSKTPSTLILKKP